MDQSLVNINKLISLFLAETLRSRRISLTRAAEISSRVAEDLPKISSEDQALAMLTEIEKDFQEIDTLKKALHFGYKQSDAKAYEEEIKAYAAKAFEKDIALSNAFLQDANQPHMSISQLCIKYPDFCSFLITTSAKAKNLAIARGI